MRLLNTTSFLIEEFIGENVPRYAILSHRWEEAEVTLQDMQTLESTRDWKKQGWAKVRGCCERGLHDGLQWVWIDTCCIDKTSSAELSEAINSMFDWYREAKVCYAYLSDVPSRGDLKERDNMDDAQRSAFASSKWFTRGWTLQELLAPKRLVFYDNNWKRLGTKDNLSDLVWKTTGIQDLKSYDTASVAQKMSWASKRETTRVEDTAYSLLGIFGVNMSIFYGEGRKAFVRLQLEILNISDDESIFSWVDEGDLSGSLLAKDPAAFQWCGKVLRLPLGSDTPPYWMTNKGLRLEKYLFPERDPSSAFDVKDAYLMPLQCTQHFPLNDVDHRPLTIYLRRVCGSQFARIHSGKVASLTLKHYLKLGDAHDPEYSRRQMIYVKQRKFSENPFRGPYAFHMDSNTLHLAGFSASLNGSHVSMRNRSKWTDAPSGKSLTVDKLSPEEFTAALEFKRQTGFRRWERFWIVIDINEYRVHVESYIPGKSEDVKKIDLSFFALNFSNDGRHKFTARKCLLNSVQEIVVKLTKLEGESVRQLRQEYRVIVVLKSITEENSDDFKAVAF